MRSEKDGVPFHCETCDDKLKDGRNCGNRKRLNYTCEKWSGHADDAILQEHKKEMRQTVWPLGDLSLYECPISYITPETYQLIDMVVLCKDSGVLINEGGWSNQPNKFVEAYLIYKEEFSAWVKRSK